MTDKEWEIQGLPQDPKAAALLRRLDESRQMWRARLRQSNKIERLVRTESVNAKRHPYTRRAKRGLPFVSAIPKYQRADTRYDQQRKAEILYKTGPRGLRLMLRISKMDDHFNPSLEALTKLKMELGHVYF